MDLGSEISQKFKSSIKKKLKESGTYIDDELPEYIMVMIANKRNEYQMKEDLSLFLGDETEQFVIWLFVMLKRLQNATQVENVEHWEANTSSSTQENIPGKVPESTSQIQTEKPESKEVQEEYSEIKETVQDISLNEASLIDSKEIEVFVEPKQDVASKETDKKQQEEKEETKIVRISHDKKQKRRHRSGSSSNKKYESSDDEKRQSKSSSRRRTSTSGSSSKKLKPASNDENEEEKEIVQQVASQISVQKVRPSLPASRQASGLLIRRAMKEANLSVTTQHQSEAKQVKETENHLPDISIELTNDRKNIHIKTDNKHKLIANNITSLTSPEVKADVTETEAEDLIVKRPKVVEPEKAQDDGIEIEVPENEFSDEETESKTRLDKRIIITRPGMRQESDDIRKEAKASGQNNVDRNSSDYWRDEKNSSGDKQRRDRRKHKHRRERSSHRERRQGSPRFVVTLHGAAQEEHARQEKRRKRNPRRGYGSSDEDPLFIDLNPKAPMEMLESAQQEINKMAHRLDMMQNTLPPPPSLEQYTAYPPSNTSTVPALPSVIPSLPTLYTCKPGSSGSLGIVPAQLRSGLFQRNPLLQPGGVTGVIPLPTPVIVMQNASGPRDPVPTSNRSGFNHGSREVIVPVNSQLDSELSENENVDQMEQDEDETLLERCKFWPSCRNASCQYIHPSKPCRTFPNCTFKDKCIFFHPMCKFDRMCTKSACPYTHSKKQTSQVLSGIANGVQVDKKIAICHFYPNCSKSNCLFRHPPSKPCRFGSGCNRPSCPYHHETQPATGDALKWNAGLKNSPAHISERSFATSSEDVTAQPITIATR